MAANPDTHSECPSNAVKDSIPHHCAPVRNDILLCVVGEGKMVRALLASRPLQRKTPPTKIDDLHSCVLRTHTSLSAA